MNFSRYFTTKSWWGKVFGAFFGYLIAGPAGALLGILVGNMFDKGMAALSPPHWAKYRDYRTSTQSIFFQTTFAIMGHIAKSDGRISENEIDMAKRTMGEMRLNREQKKIAVDFFNQGKSSTYNVSKHLQELKMACFGIPELLKLFMDIQYRCAHVDGLTPNKIRVLDAVFRQLGFAPLHRQHRFYEDFSSGPYGSSGSYSKQPDMSTTHLAQAFAILEVNEKSSQAEVKKAYRRLISQNHPDKLIAKGLPAEMIKLANDKTQKITKAYQTICTSKGW